MRSNLPMNITQAMFRSIKQGATGGTYSVNGRPVPTDGFFVGGGVPALINPTPAQVLAYVETAAGDFVGFWEDPETLALYVDTVDHVYSPRAAERLSQVRQELAYWDVRNSQEVKV